MLLWLALRAGSTEAALLAATSLASHSSAEPGAEPGAERAATPLAALPLSAKVSAAIRHLAATPPFALVAGCARAPRLPVWARSPYVRAEAVDSAPEADEVADGARDGARAESSAKVRLTSLPPPSGYPKARATSASDESHYQLSCSTVVLADALVGGVHEFELTSEMLTAKGSFLQGFGVASTVGLAALVAEPERCARSLPHVIPLHPPSHSPLHSPSHSPSHSPLHPPSHSPLHSPPHTPSHNPSHSSSDRSEHASSARTRRYKLFQGDKIAKFFPRDEKYGGDATAELIHKNCLFCCNGYAEEKNGHIFLSRHDGTYSPSQIDARLLREHGELPTRIRVVVDLERAMLHVSAGGTSGACPQTLFTSPLLLPRPLYFFLAVR